MKRFLLLVLGLVLGIPVLLAMLLMFYPRPENLMPAHVY